MKEILSKYLPDPSIGKLVVVCIDIAAIWSLNNILKRTEILREIEATNGKIKFASATFQLVEFPDFAIKINK